MKRETPFDNIESSHEYVGLLAEAIEEAVASIDEEIAVAMAEGAGGREGKAMGGMGIRLHERHARRGTKAKAIEGPAGRQAVLPAGPHVGRVEGEGRSRRS